MTKFIFVGAPVNHFGGFEEPCRRERLEDGSNTDMREETVLGIVRVSPNRVRYRKFAAPSAKNEKALPLLRHAVIG